MRQRGNKREEILEYIKQYIQDHGYSPTIREIGDGVGISSTSGVHIYLKQMLDEGMIESDHECSPRAIRIPGYKFVKE